MTLKIAAMSAAYCWNFIWWLAGSKRRFTFPGGWMLYYWPEGPPPH
jgi:hypothetical protein